MNSCSLDEFWEFQEGIYGVKRLYQMFINDSPPIYTNAKAESHLLYTDSPSLKPHPSPSLKAQVEAKAKAWLGLVQAEACLDEAQASLKPQAEACLAEAEASLGLAEAEACLAEAQACLA